MSNKNEGQFSLLKGNRNLQIPLYQGCWEPGLLRNNKSNRKAIFLDRDGVLIEDVHYLRKPDQLRLLPNVSAALQMLQDQYYLIVITNQSGIARGFFTEDDLLNTHIELVRILSEQGAFLDGLYFCPHLEKGVIDDYRLDCHCRKPNPGMLLAAQHDFDVEFMGSYMVGDRLRDAEAAHKAGVTAISIGSETTGFPSGTIFTDNLLTAAQLIVSRDSNSVVGPSNPSLDTDIKSTTRN